MTESQKMFIHHIEVTRDLPVEVAAALKLLKDEQLTQDQLTKLVASLLQVPLKDDAEYMVADIIRS